MQDIRTLDFVSIIMALSSAIDELDMSDEPVIRAGARNAGELNSREMLYKAAYHAALADVSFMVHESIKKDGENDERLHRDRS